MVITFLLLPKNQAEPVKHLGQFWISTYPLSGSVFGQRQHVGSDGSTFTQMGSFSTDGSVRMGNSATGRGALFTEKQDSLKKFGMDDDLEW